MRIRPTAEDVRSALRPKFHLHCLVGAALTLSLSSCSSDGSQSITSTPAPSLPAPASERAPTPPTATPVPEGATAANAASMEADKPVAPASEGQQVMDLAPPAKETDSGGSTPSTPAPSAEGTPPSPSVPDPRAAVPSTGCGKTRTLADGNQTITSGGMNRTYFLETPSDYDSAVPYRVVFMFHWNYGSINAIVNPPDADQNTDRPFYGFGDLTDNATIFVVPQGLVGPTGGAGWDNPNGRDVNFTDDMLAAISSDLCIDTSRVFTTGFSYGAGMSVALACVRPDKFRAAAVYEPAFISGVNAAQCTTPIAFFQSHGVDDQIINYQTGLSVLNTFTGLNGCTAMTPPDPATNGHNCVSYQGCSLPTRFCNFGSGEGNPHNTSLRGHYPVAKDPGQSTSWIPAEAWSFITQF
jgi:poly(3-hydroxybutyrate) depolymerase